MIKTLTGIFKKKAEKRDARTPYAAGYPPFSQIIKSNFSFLIILIYLKIDSKNFIGIIKKFK
jgi:hypothetical protein